MEVLVKVIQVKIRNMYSEILQVSELNKKGIISAEVRQVFEEAEKRKAKRKKKKVNILKLWLGWDNLRQLLQVLRELRLTVHSQSATKREKSSTTAKTAQLAEEFQPENGEILDRFGDLLVEDWLLDDEDLEDDQAEAIAAVCSAECKEEEGDEEEDCDEIMSFEDVADNDERNLVEFANNQLERMQQIRDRLLAIPDEEEREDVSEKQILSIPLSKRWLLFSRLV